MCCQTGNIAKWQTVPITTLALRPTNPQPAGTPHLIVAISCSRDQYSIPATALGTEVRGQRR